MKNVLIIGASGMIGSLILKQCLDAAAIQQVVSIVRKAGNLKHHKLREVIHKDFSDFTAIKSEFKQCDIAFYCVGVYTGAVDDEQFRKITVDYTVAFAETLAQQSPSATVCFMSGQGADRTEKSRIAFARYKGMAENKLFSQNFAHCYAFRPAYIFPVEKREEPNAFYRLMRSCYPLIALLGKNFSIRSTELAKVMFQTGLHPQAKNILENRDIRALV